METPAPLPATRQITRPRTPRKQESLGTRRSEKSTPQKAPKRKASSSVVRPTPTKKPFLQKNRTGLAPKKLLPVCNEQCVYCRKTLDDQEPHYSWNCTYVSVHGIDNNCDDTSSPELRRSQKKYVKLAIATSQKCRVHLQDGKKRVSEALLLKLNPCGAKCCLSCAPAPNTAAATATAATGSPAATGAARTGAAAVSPAAEVPEVAAEVEAAVLASQYNWLERTAGGVQPTLTLT